jgi:hypothetical protein
VIVDARTLSIVATAHGQGREHDFKVFKRSGCPCHAGLEVFASRFDANSSQDFGGRDTPVLLEKFVQAGDAHVRGGRHRFNTFKHGWVAFGVVDKRIHRVLFELERRDGIRAAQLAGSKPGLASVKWRCEKHAILELRLARRVATGAAINAGGAHRDNKQILERRVPGKSASEQGLRIHGCIVRVLVLECHWILARLFL